MKNCTLSCLVALVAASLLFVGCESDEDTYVSPSGQEVAPDVVINTPSDAVTLNLLIGDKLQYETNYYTYIGDNIYPDISLDDAFNWSVLSGNGGYDLGYPYEVIGETIVFRIRVSEMVYDLGAMNGLGNITNFSAPNPATKCAITQGHGYIFYLQPTSVIYEGDWRYPNDDEVLNSFAKNCPYCCIWVEKVSTEGITIKYVIRKNNATN